MRPDLMASSGDQFNLKHRQIMSGISVRSPSKRCVSGADLLGFGYRLFQNPDSVFVPVFYQVPLDRPSFFNMSQNDCTVKLVDCPVMKQLRELLQTCHGFPHRHNAAGIAVKAVADRWPEGKQILLRQGAGAQQITDRVFVQGKILIMRFLRQHARRLIYKQDILILIENVKSGCRITLRQALSALLRLRTDARELFQGFLRKKNPDQIPFRHFLAAIRTASVQGNILLPQHLMQKGSGRLFQVFPEKLIQALSCLQGRYFQFSHKMRYPFCRKFDSFDLSGNQKLCSDQP